MTNKDHDSLLDTDIRIIHEDDRYAVVAVRIPKAFFRDNIHFFAAAADLAPNDAPALVGGREPT